MRPKDKLASARLMAVEKLRYFRAAILGLVPRECAGLNTFGVTKHGVLLWDPAALERWSVEETAGVLVHEVSHRLRQHSDRCERYQAEHELWNIAGDLEINDDLAHIDLPLPEEGITPAKLRADPLAKKMKLNFDDNLTAEEYYHELRKIPRPKVVSICGIGEEGDGDKEGDEKGGSGKGDDKKPGVGRGKCGGCAGNPGPEEDKADKEDGRSEVELERIKRQVAADIRKEAEKGRGTVPGGWVRWAEQQLQPPQIPWQQKLARACRNAVAYRPGAVDYHFNKPSRRQAGIGYGVGKPVLPALRAPVPQVSVCVDTSGSMGDAELLDAVSETRGILAATGANVTFCACDAEVHAMQKVSSWKDVIKLLKGGGGTDFRPIFRELGREKPRCDVAIVITDGCGPAPETPPPYRVIWVLVGPYQQTPADWGETISLDKADKEKAA